jgi:hypothetical protein
VLVVVAPGALGHLDELRLASRVDDASDGADREQRAKAGAARRGAAEHALNRQLIALDCELIADDVRELEALGGRVVARESNAVGLA